MSRWPEICVYVCVLEELVPPWVTLGPSSLCPVLKIPPPRGAAPVSMISWSLSSCLPGTGESWLVLRDVHVDGSTWVGVSGVVYVQGEARITLCSVSVFKRLVLELVDFTSVCFEGGACMWCER